MQWWCSAQGVAWEWTWQAYPGVWAFIAALAAAYVFVLRRSTPTGGVRGPGPAGPGSGSGRPPRPAVFAAGLLVLWAALDWPLGALGAGYLASAHMVQFLLIALVAAPLLLIGLPDRILDGLTPRAQAVVSLLTHPLPALVAFNLIVAATHIPRVVDALMVSQTGSFAIDLAWLGGGLLFWWPVAGPAPGGARRDEMVRVAYLGLEALALTPLFVFLTFSRFPSYATYELAPRVYGLSARTDNQLAGLLMKVGGMVVFLTAVGILFLHWSRRWEDSRPGSPPSRGDVALERSGHEVPP